MKNSTVCILSLMLTILNDPKVRAKFNVLFIKNIICLPICCTSVPRKLV